MNSYYKLLKYLSVLTLALVAGACDSINNPTGPHSTQNLLKSETKWKCDASSGSKISKAYYREYDQSGNVVKSVEYSDAGSVDVETKYTYDDDESFEEKTHYDVSGQPDSVSLSAYKLDNQGKITRKINFTQLGDTLSILKYAYDDQGNITLKTEVSPAGSVITETKYSYTYSPGGDIVERLTNPGANGAYQSRDTIIYQMQDKKIERLNYNSFGTIETKFSYFYNLTGKLIKEVESASDGTTVNIFAYEYEYY